MELLEFRIIVLWYRTEIVYRLTVKKIFIYILFLFSFPILAQTDSIVVQNNVFIVDSIKISGNQITESFIILREINFQSGDTISLYDLQYNEERIYSLGLFNFVDLKKESTDRVSNVIISVNETWYIYPIPFYRLVNEKVRYGLSVLWKNFRGRNEKLSAMISLGYNPYYLFVYQNPIINEKYDLGLSVSSLFQRVANPSRKLVEKIKKDFEYKFFSNSVSVEKRINQFNSINTSLGYSYVESPQMYYQSVTASSERIDRYTFIGFSYFYDTRDLKQYARIGCYFFASFLYKGFNIQEISHSIINLDFSKFMELAEPFSQKLRIATRFTAGNSVPVYDYSYLGHTEFIRGHKDDIREGNNRIVANYEIDLPVIKEWALKLDLPLLPTNLTSARIGIHITAFADAGTVFNNFDEIQKARLDKGWGFGINLLFLPYNGLRFEYAFNENGKGEFLIGTGLSF